MGWVTIRVSPDGVKGRLTRGRLCWKIHTERFPRHLPARREEREEEMKRIRIAVAAGIVAAVATAGCAKKELVKAEEQPTAVEVTRAQEETPAPPISEAVREVAATEE